MKFPFSPEMNHVFEYSILVNLRDGICRVENFLPLLVHTEWIIHIFDQLPRDGLQVVAQPLEFLRDVWEF